MENKYLTGTIVSADLTVDNAIAIKDFYASVIGWDIEEFKMSDKDGAYTDFVTKDSGGNWVGGVCHKRGVNADQPPQWIVYINVEDIQQSMDKCEALGGTVLKVSAGKNGVIQFAILSDPGGTVIGITKA